MSWFCILRRVITDITDLFLTHIIEVTAGISFILVCRDPAWLTAGHARKKSNGIGII